MNDSLSKVQKAARVLEVLSVVARVIVAIGAVGSLVGLAVWLVASNIPIDGETYAEVVFRESGKDGCGMIIDCLNGFIQCASGFVIYSVSRNYFASVRLEGTPFTHKGAKAIFNLGLTALVATLVATVVSAFVTLIVTAIMNPATLTSTEGVDGNVGIPIVLMILSLVFHYGADLEEQKNRE